MSLSRALAALSQPQTEMGFQVQSTAQDTTPGAVIFAVFPFFTHRQGSKQGISLHKPSLGVTALSSCLPALNSTFKTLSFLLARPLLTPVCGIVHFFHAGDVPTVSQLPACQHLGSITHGGELGCAMEPDGCGGELRRKGLQRKGATAQGRSLHHRPALPCFYILPAFIHTFRLVLSTSSPVNTRLCCVFLRNQLGFSIGSSV